MRGGTVIKLKEFVNEKGELDFKLSHYHIQRDGKKIFPENHSY